MKIRLHNAAALLWEKESAMRSLVKRTPVFTHNASYEFPALVHPLAML